MFADYHRVSLICLTSLTLGRHGYAHASTKAENLAKFATLTGSGKAHLRSWITWMCRSRTTSPRG